MNEGLYFIWSKNLFFFFFFLIFMFIDKFSFFKICDVSVNSVILSVLKVERGQVKSVDVANSSNLLSKNIEKLLWNPAVFRKIKYWLGRSALGTWSDLPYTIPLS